MLCLEWKAPGRTGTVEGSTRRNVRRVHAVNSAGRLAREVCLESAREDSVFRDSQRELVGAFLGAKFGAGTTQNVMYFLKPMEVDGTSVGTYFRCLEFEGIHLYTRQ